MALDGLLLIDKPTGITSHDVVDVIRRKFGLRRVGHGGTLDPLATGLLILLVGAATRTASSFLGADKTYLATLRLGVSTDTQDITGTVVETRPVEPFTRDQLEKICDRFRGEIEQTLPAYSAVRIGGKRSYELARAGKVVPPQLRQVMIHQLKILAIHPTEVEFEVTSSKGTYIRTLCADIGAALGCGGTLSQLRRTRIGAFTLDQAVKLEDATPQHLLPIDPVRPGDRRLAPAEGRCLPPERA